MPSRLVPFVFVLILPACQSDAERYHAETIYHLENVVGILERAAGNMDAAVNEIDRYYLDNQERIAKVRTDGLRLLDRMSPEDRTAFGKRALERTRHLRERIETLARTFPDPPRILLKVQRFL